MRETSKSSLLNTITLGDKILVVIMIALSAFSVVALNHFREMGERVVIEVDGNLVHQLDLNVAQQVTVTGPIGKTVIKIDHGSARVVYSDCPEKICVMTGEIQQSGDMIVCAPNKVVVKIEGKKQNQFDVITQ